MQIINHMRDVHKLCFFIPSLFGPNGDRKGLFTIESMGQWAKGADFKGKTGQESCLN